MIELLKSVFELVPARDLLFALLIVGLMYLNWSKDRMIRELNASLVSLAGDFNALGELLRTLVYGRDDRRGRK